MPRKGYKSITITERAYTKISTLATIEGNTVPELIEKTCANFTPIFPNPNFFDLLEMSPQKFQKFILHYMKGKATVLRNGDGGIDGYAFNDAPVQVKQSTNIGRNIVDNFETAIRRQKKKEGYIVAFSFTPGAANEAKRAEEDGLIIHLLNVKALLQTY